MGYDRERECDGSGMGGCPYCGNGQATGVAATEDVMPTPEGMGIETGVHLDKLIECVWMCEEILSVGICGDTSPGRGPRPPSVKALCNHEVRAAVEPRES